MNVLLIKCIWCYIVTENITLTLKSKKSFYLFSHYSHKQSIFKYIYFIYYIVIYDFFLNDRTVLYIWHSAHYTHFTYSFFMAYIHRQKHYCKCTTGHLVVSKTTISELLTVIQCQRPICSNTAKVWNALRWKSQKLHKHSHCFKAVF